MEVNLNNAFYVFSSGSMFGSLGKVFKGSRKSGKGIILLVTNNIILFCLLNN